jgi:hypothetical protein
MSKKDRTPKAIEHHGSKSPRIAVDPEDTNRLTPVWSIARFDHEGPWGRNACTPDEILWGTIFPKMRNYETMTWNEILRNKWYNHSIEVARLIKAARDRLVELGLDDYEELFRFRLEGTGRVWGIRDGRIFQILWWDADHNIYPYNKD